MHKRILIIGGTSGVGAELAKHYVNAGHDVWITGRRRPEKTEATFLPLNISADPKQLAQDLDLLLADIGKLHTLIFAAGYLQRGHIDDLTDDGLATMVNTGLLAPMLLVQRLKREAIGPLKVILISSSSQYTPREREPAYSATKAAMGMLGASLARDPDLGKVLVVAPSGIATAFWDGSGEDTSTMLDPHWVSNQIVDLFSGPFKYKYAKILRRPARVEVVECLNNQMEPAIP